MIKWDGHTHTHFCRHGSDAHMSAYIEEAIRQGFQRYTLSEHPPLPEGWVDNPALMKELAMKEEELPDYFRNAWEMKRRYEGQIELMVGLELDYLPGSTDFALRLIDKWGAQIEDAVVSVHYLPGTGGMRCIDFTPQDFTEGLLDYYGSMDAVVEEYYNHVEATIEWMKQLPFRARIGHINLIEKFRLVLPEADPSLIDRRLQAILPKLQAAEVGIDVNTAGFRKATCGKAYVPEWLLKRSIEMGIPAVFGSDAHRPDEVGSGWEWFAEEYSSAK